MERIIPYIVENKKCVKPPTRRLIGNMNLRSWMRYFIKNERGIMGGICWEVLAIWQYGFSICMARSYMRVFGCYFMRRSYWLIGYVVGCITYKATTRNDTAITCNSFFTITIHHLHRDIVHIASYSYASESSTLKTCFFGLIEKWPAGSQGSNMNSHSSPSPSVLQMRLHSIDQVSWLATPGRANSMDEKMWKHVKKYGIKCILLL